MISFLSFLPLYIEMFFDNTKLSSGTGFIMKSNSGTNYLLTNRHNVTGRNNETGVCLSSQGAVPNRVEITHFRKSPLIHEWFNSAERYGSDIAIDDDTYNSMRERIIKSEVLQDAFGNDLWFEHPLLKERADFVALKLTDQVDAHIISFSKGLSRPLKVGLTETVSVIGYPFGKSNNNFPVWATGTIASDPIFNFNDLPITLIDCRSRGGQSGSPVFLYKNSGFATFENHSIMNVTTPIARFLGIYSGRIHKDSDIGFVWHESAIYELIDSLP